MKIKTGREKFAVLGLVFGIGSIPLLYPFPFAILCSAIGLILSLKGIKSSWRKTAIAGLVLSALVLAVSGALAIAVVVTGGRCLC